MEQWEYSNSTSTTERIPPWKKLKSFAPCSALHICRVLWGRRLCLSGTGEGEKERDRNRDRERDRDRERETERETERSEDRKSVV